jgi:hypothetical protein
LEELAALFADAFRARQEGLSATVAHTDLAVRGDSSAALQHFLFAAAVRLAREELEATRDLPPWPEHGDGSRWVWWAEEPTEELAETEVE